MSVKICLLKSGDEVVADVKELLNEGQLTGVTNNENQS